MQSNDPKPRSPRWPTRIRIEQADYGVRNAAVYDADTLEVVPFVTSVTIRLDANKARESAVYVMADVSGYPDYKPGTGMLWGGALLETVEYPISRLVLEAGAPAPEGEHES